MISMFAMVACGPDCWEAKHDKCRCSCGGKNHGVRRPQCLPSGSGKPLRRQMVWMGYIWELERASVPEHRGSGYYAPDAALETEAISANKAGGVYYWPSAHTSREPIGGMPVAIVRTFTDKQVESYQELAAWREPQIHPSSSSLYGRPKGLWRRNDEVTNQVNEQLKAKGGAK